MTSTLTEGHARETDWLKPWRPKVDAEPPGRPNLDQDSTPSQRKVETEVGSRADA
jgi:hypothetical protein